MLIAIVDFDVTQQNRASALAALLSEVETVRAMSGCLNFRPFTDPQSKTHVGVLHEWNNEESFAAYLASDGFAKIGAMLRPIMTKPPSSRRFHAELIENIG